MLFYNCNMKLQKTIFRGDFMMYFEDLKKDTKKAGGFISNFRNNTNNSLFDVYQKPSYNKIKIFEDIKKQMMEQEEAFNFSVVSGGSGYFTMACENKKYVFYITYAHNYRIEK